MDPSSTTNVVATQATLAVIISWVMQNLKQATWFPWITAETQGLNRMVAILLAALTSVGIDVTWNATTHTLIVANLTLSAVGLFLWNWIKQYAFQHAAYKVMYDKSPAAPAPSVPPTPPMPSPLPPAVSNK